ncbi:CYFA0S10e01376g1_1 [Cyberlindnera fabianii]|uniref:DNA mismatch repair protein PMS1 n=1 Tax=Cyberlindnera fabianii TaxID=36022 RepID=A0A061AYH0_CYBFA|nr:CYFA0S10e01376g1_1 [Cyberlindnera fabianii]
MSIRTISQEDVHRLTSGQVIVDLSTAVKELVENSLDAHATQVECHFKNYGMDSLEITDNGDGISEDDFEGIALKHHTSKLSSFQDLERVNTLGFRGEALSSLCGIASLKIITTRKGPKATQLTFATSGAIQDKKICTRNKGTTVSVSELFKNLPVRKKDMIKNHKREFNKCLSLLQDYTLINTNVKFTVYNTTPKGKKTLVLSSQGSGIMKNNVISVYGSNGMHGLVPISLRLDLNQYKSKLKVIDTNNDYTINITGLISKTSFGYGRSATDRQCLYINKRPVELKPFTKMINEVYKTYNNVQYPVIILDFEMDTHYLDVNVTPNKRTILIHNEMYVIEELRTKLIEFWDGLDISIPRNMDGQRSIEELRNFKTEKDQEIEKKPSLGLKMGGFAFTQETASQAPTQSDAAWQADEDVPAAEIEPDEQDANDDVSNDSSNAILEIGHHESLEQSEDALERKRPSDTQLIEAAQKRAKDFLAEPQLDDNNDIDEDSSTEQLDGLTQQELDELVLLNESEDVPEQSNEPLFVEESDSGPEDTEGFMDVNEKPVTEQERDKPVITQRPAVRSKVIDLSQISSFRNGPTTPSTKHSSRAPFNLKSTKTAITTDQRKDNCHCSHESEEEEEEEEDEEDEGNMNSTLVNNLDGTPDTQIGSDGSAGDDDNEGEEVQVTKVEVKKEKTGLFYETTTTVPLEFAQCCTIANDTDEKTKVEIDDIDNQEESENYLTLTVSKSDFNDMKVIGQFNLGFILVIREKNGKKDLFIVDQHASDEKFNFEDLQKNTVFDSQRLVIPQTLELNVLDELLVMQNKEVFEKNGFQIKLDEEGTPGERIKLISLPISKRKAFDVSDFNELVHLVSQNQGNTSSVRCSKIRSMFAMRACRKSIMVGKHLSHKTMKRLVKNLGTLDKPWNCPHGRPTMRHLIELQQWKPYNDDYAL